MGLDAWYIDVALLSLVSFVNECRNRGRSNTGVSRKAARHARREVQHDARGKTVPSETRSSDHGLRPGGGRGIRCPRRRPQAGERVGKTRRAGGAQLGDGGGPTSTARSTWWADTRPRGRASTPFRCTTSPADKWELTTPYPTTINHASAVALDGRLYVIGGQDQCRRTEGTVALHRRGPRLRPPGTGKWDATGGRCPPSAAPWPMTSIDGKIYVAGGRPPPGPRFRRLRPQGGQVDDAGPTCPPSATTWRRAAIDGKLYVVGGRFRRRLPQRDHRGPSRSYDPATRPMGPRAGPCPTPGAVTNGILVKGCFHTFGGGASNGGGPAACSRTTRSYNPRTDTWDPPSGHAHTGPRASPAWSTWTAGSTCRGAASGEAAAAAPRITRWCGTNMPVPMRTAGVTPDPDGGWDAVSCGCAAHRRSVRRKRQGLGNEKRGLSFRETPWPLSSVPVGRARGSPGGVLDGLGLADLAPDGNLAAHRLGGERHLHLDHAVPVAGPRSSPRRCRWANRTVRRKPAVDGLAEIVILLLALPLAPDGQEPPFHLDFQLLGIPLRAGRPRST